MSSREQLVELYWIKGLNPDEVGKKIGLSFKTVYAQMKKLKIPTRRGLVPEFCKWAQDKNIDFYVRHYLLAKKYFWAYKKNKRYSYPRLEVHSRSKESLFCFKRYLQKHNIRCGLSYSHKDLWFLRISGFENFRLLCAEFDLPYWSELENRRKYSRPSRKGEVQAKILEVLKEEYVGSGQILNLLNWERTISNYARIASSFESLIKKGIVEKKKVGRKNFYKLKN